MLPVRRSRSFSRDGLVRALLVLVTAAPSACARTSVASTSPRAVVSDAAEAPADDEAAARVRAAFLHAWHAYRERAWGHDEVRPLSGAPYDWYGTSLLMTPVDAFDTMLLMGLDTEASATRALILDRLSFDRDVRVQVFEVTIRLLGGLLSAWQMDGDPGFLRLAEDLGRRLLPAFDSPTGMPYRFVNLRTGAVDGPESNPAEVATLVLELGTLSRATGDPVFYDTAERAVRELFARRSALGLVGSGIDVRTGAWTDPDSHVGGGIDSYYEYLLKACLLFDDEDFCRMWRESRAPLRRWLADERFDGIWYGHADMDTGARTATRFGALDAFLPGVLALAGDTASARRLMASVERMWTTFGVEPEVLDYSDMSVVSPGYQLRPEAVESAYYLWRLTGDARFRTMGLDMFRRLEAATRVPGGYAALADVRTGETQDRMHSFLLAETFKYAWLLTRPPAALELEGVVLNTEAHPLRRTR